MRFSRVRVEGVTMILLWLMLAFTKTSVAMIAKGTSAVPPNSTIFLSKFCFSYLPSTESEKYSSYDAPEHDSGVLEMDVHVKDYKPGQAVHLLVFDDEAHSYPGPSGQWDSLPCAERVKHAKDDFLLDNSVGRYRIHVRQKLRPRWWYVALADCSGTGLTSVEYKVHAKNIIYGWAEEFSSDRQLALPAFVVLTVIFFCLAMAQLRANAALALPSHDDSAGGKAAHPFARILAVGILLELAACALEVLHCSTYAKNGRGIPAAHAASLLLSVASNFILASLLLLVSEGKCVSYRMVKADAHRMCKLLGPFLASCLILELWGDFATSRTYSTDYAYTTNCGRAIIAVDLGLLCTYAWNLRATLQLEGGRADSRFYQTWGIAYGIWFLALPFSAFLSQTVLAPYVWYIVSVAITKCLTALAYGALVIALWPENTRTHFKMVTASPEELMETCPSPPNRQQEATFPADLGHREGLMQWVMRPQDVPSLLRKQMKSPWEPSDCGKTEKM